jgi:hypothetical protein
MKKKAAKKSGTSKSGSKPRTTKKTSLSKPAKKAARKGAAKKAAAKKAGIRGNFRAICRSENNRPLTSWTTKAITDAEMERHENENPSHTVDYEER